MPEISVIQFKGIRNDRGLKHTSPEYLSDITNLNLNSIIGLDKLLLPDIYYNGNNNLSINGAFRFNYLNSNNILVSEDIFVVGGNIYKNLITPVLLKSGLSSSLYSFTVLNDKLFMFNGKDYPQVYNGNAVYEMGAPYAEQTFSSGNPNGTYYYAITFVTAAGEEYIGTVSNTILTSNNKILLTIPIGYDGTLTRKIYRTENGGSVLKLLASIGDNTTISYLDNVADGSLTTIIPNINNECPRPYFGVTSNERLICAVTDSYPTQLYISDAEIEVLDSSAYTDVSNISGDNTAIKGMAKDYDKVIVGSEKEIYIVDVSGTVPSISPTRANVGVKNGYTMSKIPNNEDFEGGIFFLSTLNDVRIFNGNFAQPVATSLDNLKSYNWSQIIQNSFINDVKSADKLYAIFYDYKYHLIADDKVYLFDIRTQSWSKYIINTDNYSLDVNCFFVLGDGLYSGQKNNSIIEKWYQEKQYRSENVLCTFKTPQMLYSEKVKYIKSLFINFIPGQINKFTVKIFFDGDYYNPILQEIDFNAGAFFEHDFFEEQFNSDLEKEDYREIFLNRFARFVEFIIENSEEHFYYRGFRITYDELDN